MSATLPAAPNIDRDRVATLMEREQARLRERTAGSGEMFARASAVMPGGVPSQFQKSDPWPVYLTRGSGATVWDVDGNEYTDFHNGFGVMTVGHAHPAIVEACSERFSMGTHFAQPVAETTLVAEELRSRFNLDMVRFTNSGTESTMDACRLARAYKQRDKLIKIEGSYHGHHETVMV